MLYQLYDRFFISNEAEKYRLFLGRNTAGTLDNRMTNSLMPHGVYERLDLNGTSFSTPDRDNDWAPHGHCAALQRGGWWFHRCYSAFLNGLWASKKWIKPWFPAVHYGTHLRGTWMMVKRIERDD
ncbi:ryncolin-4-like [Saccostrea cucullata]|uniref:ryncolin-4-like n=1 Tax=Saccostrea cuccullata TaxID=36930 RepID=UPI002ED0B41E